MAEETFEFKIPIEISAETMQRIAETVVAEMRKNPNADWVEVVRCKDCIHRPTDTGGHNDGEDLEFPDGICPCQCSEDPFYSWMPDDDWFCKDGERRIENETSKV